MAMPLALTSSCIGTEPELSISTKLPTNERKTPRQKTAIYCSPHTISGLKILHSSPGQSFDTNRVTTNAATMKCSAR